MPTYCWQARWVCPQGCQCNSNNIGVVQCHLAKVPASLPLRWAIRGAWVGAWLAHNHQLPTSPSCVEAECSADKAMWVTTWCKRTAGWPQSSVNDLD